MIQKDLGLIYPEEAQKKASLSAPNYIFFFFLLLLPYTFSCLGFFFLSLLIRRLILEISLVHSGKLIEN